MWNRLKPDFYHKTLYDIDFKKLQEDNIRGIIFDLDNTLVEWGSDYVDRDLVKKVRDLHKMGFRMCIVSNNMKGRVRKISDKLGISSTPNAVKPLPGAYRKAMEVLGTGPSETALIGDQLFTDILGGNIAGVMTILINPLTKREFLTTKFFRMLEKVAYRKLGLKKDK